MLEITEKLNTVLPSGQSASLRILYLRESCLETSLPYMPLESCDQDSRLEKGRAILKKFSATNDEESKKPAPTKAPITPLDNPQHLP